MSRSFPDKGSADITQGLLTGAVDFALDSVPNSLPLIEAGKFRALAKYSNRPLPILPDVPSLLVAAGLPGIDESSTWIGLVAPAAAPKAVIDKLQREVAKIFAEPAMAERLRQAGLFAESSTAEELDAFIRSESARWKKLIESGVADKIFELNTTPRVRWRRGQTRTAPAQPAGLKMRCAEGGLRMSFAAGRIGRGEKLPPQFGHTPLSLLSTQSRQNVHSNVNIIASAAAGGKILVAAFATRAQFEHCAYRPVQLRCDNQSFRHWLAAVQRSCWNPYIHVVCTDLVVRFFERDVKRLA